MRAAYTGRETLTFPDYTDLETGRTLTAVPGQSYDIAPASGRLVDGIPEAWFTPVQSTDGSATATAGKAKRQSSPGDGDDGPAEEELREV